MRIGTRFRVIARNANLMRKNASQINRSSPSTYNVSRHPRKETHTISYQRLQRSSSVLGGVIGRRTKNRGRNRGEREEGRGGKENKKTKRKKQGNEKSKKKTALAPARSSILGSRSLLCRPTASCTEAQTRPVGHAVTCATWRRNRLVV